MSGIGGYNYKGTNDFVIENGIIKGYDLPKDTENIDNYGEIILNRLKSQPNFVAQVDGLTGREVTFAEMLEKSVKCAIWLNKQNIQPGDVIAICSLNHVDMYIPYFAALYVGAVYNAWWKTKLNKEVAKHFISLSRSKIVFAANDMASMILEAAEEIGAKVKLVIFEEQSPWQTLNEILAGQDDNLVPKFRCTKLSSLDEPAFIMYTSGTSEAPKGVLFSHKSLRANVKNFATVGEMSSLTSLSFSLTAWVVGHYSMHRSVVVPDKRIIYPKYSEEVCCQLIEKFKVNWLFLSPGLALTLIQSPATVNYDLSSVKFLLSGSTLVVESLLKGLAEIFPNGVFCQAYGMTEMGALGVLQGLKYKPGSCGRVVKNFALKIVDPKTGEILGPNKSGEACFKYPFMMTGFYRNPEETRKVIDSEGWLHTGDLIFYDEEGHLFYVDRLKELIRYKSEDVSPTMIERVLLTHPGVAEAVVVGVPHEIDQSQPIAFVVKRRDVAVTEAELQKMVADALPDYMRLRGGVKFLTKLPLTPSDKIARGELKKLAKSCAHLKPDEVHSIS